MSTTPLWVVSAHDVIDKMSFSPSQKKKERTNNTTRGSLIPVAPPPAGAPPTPPPTPPPQSSRSYQQQQQQRDEINVSSTRLAGDASLRPNVTGRSNSAMGEGTALHQVLRRITRINLLVCVLAVLGLGWNLLTLSWIVHPSLGVLSIYTILFLGVLLLHELQIYQERLRDNFGMLTHAISRSIFMLLLAALVVGCSGGSIGLYALGLILFANAIYTQSVYCMYPEYRRMQQTTFTQTSPRVQHLLNSYFSTRTAWTNPDAAVVPVQEEPPIVEGERQPLVSHV